MTVVAQFPEGTLQYGAVVLEFYGYGRGLTRKTFGAGQRCGTIDRLCGALKKAKSY